MFDYLPPAPHGADPAEAAYAASHDAGFSLSGLVFADAVSFDGVSGAPDRESETGIRLAELSAQGRLGDIDWTAGYDFARDGEWRDVGLTTTIGGIQFSLGQFKEPLSLTKYTPQGGTVMLEASRYGSVFAIGRRLGLIARYDAGPVSLQASVTDGALDDEAVTGFGRGQRAVMVRASTALIEETRTVHFGAYARHLDYDGEGVTLKAGPHPALAPKTSKVALTDYYGREARSSLLTGAEVGVSAGRWYAALDAGRMAFDMAAGDFDVHAASLEASVALTGESRPYYEKKGVFKPVTPATPLGAGGIGAVELTARADIIDFGEALGGETTSYAVGMTWTPRDNVRVLANYTHESGGRYLPESESYGFRLQLSF